MPWPCDHCHRPTDGSLLPITLPVTLAPDGWACVVTVVIGKDGQAGVVCPACLAAAARAYVAKLTEAR